MKHLSHSEELALKQAVTRALERAGFVNIRTSMIRDMSRTSVRALADCPCGLGVSGFSHMLPDTDTLYQRFEYHLDYVENYIYRLAMEHIEDDKAAGRWV